MKTEDLIAVLATDTRRGRPVWPDVLFAALGPILVSGSVLLMVLGIRPDLTSAVTSPMSVWKWLLPGVLVAAGLSLALALSHPESRPRRAWLVILMATALGAGLFMIGALILPPVDWIAAIRGQSLLVCLASISGIGLTGLFSGLAVLRRGATTRPGLSGLALGLGSGGAAAILYALHCNEDDPMFFVTWYGSAILAVGLIGAISGQRLLRM